MAMAEPVSEMPRPVTIDRIGDGGTDFEVAASPAELAPLAARLKAPSVSRLVASFRLRRLPDGMFAAEGRLDAALTRECVVSLELFEEHVAEDFALVFVRADRLVEDDDPETPDQIPYKDGAIDLGEAAIEQLALAMDPFPRKPGISLEPRQEPASEPGGETVRPFADLASKLHGKG